MLIPNINSMKKSILMWLAVFCMGTVAAQTTAPATKSSQNAQVPSEVSKRFMTDYPNTQVAWTMSGTSYRAEYIDPNKQMGRAVLYDKSGNPLGVEREIAKGEYPTAINEYYMSTYPNEKYKVWIREENGRRIYFVPRTSEIVWFDDKGSYTRKNAINPGISTTIPDKDY
jgi:hypothetical protein